MTGKDGEIHSENQKNTIARNKVSLKLLKYHSSI
jgi:hypothetical protein